MLVVRSEQTHAQLPDTIYTTSEWLGQNYSKYYKTYDAMRSDATLAFARMLAVAPLVNAGWIYEAAENAPAGARVLIEDTLERLRLMFIKQAIEGYIDFGWAGYEVVWGVEDGYIVPVKLKNLIQQFTTILINTDNGEYLGLRQGILDMQGIYTLRITIDLIGTAWYGRPLFENSRLAYLGALNVSAAANQYDKKVAGSHWVIHYPIGTSPYGDPAAEIDNYKIAKDMLNSLIYSGQFVIPRRIATFIDDINKQFGEDQWKIELISDSGNSSTKFIEKLKYYDTLKVRGLGFPERSILEGQFGTKAESETHANIALVNFEMRHLILCQQINQQLVNSILMLNYGVKDSVYISPQPLVSVQQANWRQIYNTLLKDHSNEEYNALDISQLRKDLDLPEKSPDDSNS